MALRQLCNSKIRKAGLDLWKISSAYVHSKAETSDNISQEVKITDSGDLPIEMENPFVEEKPQCILCKHKIDVNYKNVRLLSQFVSRFTGRVYGRHITGLCEYQQKKVDQEILKARISGLMGGHVKHPNFLKDPDLYDISKPFKVL